jgi:hypothetical protein
MYGFHALVVDVSLCGVSAEIWDREADIISTATMAGTPTQGQITHALPQTMVDVVGPDDTETVFKLLKLMGKVFNAPIHSY